MTNPALESLFWEQIDDPAPERGRQLEALVRERPELEQELEQLRELAAFLDAVPEEPAPAELLAGVRRAITHRSIERSERASRGWLRALAGAGWRSRLAYATIAVAVAGVALHLVTGWPSPVDESDRSHLAGALNVGAAGAPLEFAFDGGGTLRFSRRGTTLTAHLFTSSDTPLQLTFEADAGLELLRAEGTSHEVVSRAKPIEVVALAPLSLTLEFDETATALELWVRTAAGEPLLERKIELAGMGTR